MMLSIVIIPWVKKVTYQFLIIAQPYSAMFPLCHIGIPEYTPWECTALILFGCPCELLVEFMKIKVRSKLAWSWKGRTAIMSPYKLILLHSGTRDSVNLFLQAVSIVKVAETTVDTFFVFTSRNSKFCWCRIAVLLPRLRTTSRAGNGNWLWSAPSNWR